MYIHYEYDRQDTEDIFTESQNHIMVKIGSDLCSSSGSRPPRADCPGLDEFKIWKILLAVR